MRRLTLKTCAIFAMLHCGANEEATSPSRVPAPSAPLVAISTPTSAPTPTIIAEFAPPPPSAAPATASTVPFGAAGDPPDEGSSALVVEQAEVHLSSGETLRAPCFESKGYFKHRVGSESGKNPLISATAVKLPMLDLDGDRKVDRLIVLGASADTYDVLPVLAKGKCVVPLGAISAFDEVHALPTSHHGLRDLASATRCEEFGSCEVEWHFDGKVYQQANAKPSKRKSKNSG